jgi:archaellin
MSTPIKVVQGDTKPTITVTLTDSATGNPIDLSDSTTTVSVYFRAAGSTTLLSTISCTKTDAANGVVQFDFAGGVLDVSQGLYEGEIEVSFDGAKHTVYNPLKFRVREDFA